MALLALAVLAVHLWLIDSLMQANPGTSVLADMAEPDFNRALLPSDDHDSRTAAQRAAELVAQAAPASTVGQVMQARTLFLPRSEPDRTKPTTAPKRPARPAKRPAPHPPAAPPAPSPPPAPAPTATPTETSAPNPDVVATADTPVSVPSPEPPSAPAPEVASPPQSSATATASTVTPPTSSEKIEQKQPVAQYPSTLSATDSEITNNTWLQAWPKSTRLSYTLTGQFRGPLYGDAQVQWQHTDTQYQAQVRVSVGLFMNMSMTSQGRITPTRLWPQAYEEERRGKKRGARLGDQTVVLDNGSTLPRPPDLQDTASQFVQLAQDFATGRTTLRVGAVVPVMLVRPGGMDEWTYDVVSQDTLNTPLGALAAFHLQPRPLAKPRGTVTVDMWFAPALQYLPVRIRLTLNPEVWLDLALDAVAQSP
jgi:outer membrane biosynthesis protein TonB